MVCAAIVRSAPTSCEKVSRPRSAPYTVSAESVACGKATVRLYASEVAMPSARLAELTDTSSPARAVPVLEAAAPPPGISLA